MDRLGHWGKFFPQLLKNGVWEKVFTWNTKKAQFPEDSKLRSAIHPGWTVFSSMVSFIGRAYAKNSFAPFSWLWGAFFLPHVCKNWSCVRMDRNWKLSQDFSKELSFLNSSHGAIRCRSRREHRENLISMSNPMKVFRFRHSLTFKPWQVWVSRHGKQPPMWELGSAKWLITRPGSNKEKARMAWATSSWEHGHWPHPASWEHVH